VKISNGIIPVIWQDHRRFTVLWGLLVTSLILTACNSTAITVPASAPVQFASLTLEVPQSNPPALDGILSPSEWDNALHEQFTDGGELFLMQSAGYLYLGMHENFKDC
jgi:hypothetical protein